MQITLNVTLKDSRGGGDNIVIPIKDKSSIVTGNNFVEITDIYGSLFMFPIHNIIYIALFVDSHLYRHLGQEMFEKVGQQNIESLNNTKTFSVI